MDPGEVWLADLGDERRRRVLVLSNRRFHSASGRVLVAPAIDGPRDAVPFPWRVEVDGVVYAVDFLRGLPDSRLLERLGHAPTDATLAARRALVHIT